MSLMSEPLTIVLEDLQSKRVLQPEIKEECNLGIELIKDVQDILFYSYKLEFLRKHMKI